MYCISCKLALLWEDLGIQFSIVHAFGNSILIKLPAQQVVMHHPV